MYTFPVVENDEPLPPTQWARTPTRPYLQVGETRYGETCMVTDHHGTGLHSENPHLEPRFPDGRGARGELREVTFVSFFCKQAATNPTVLKAGGV